MPTETEVAYLAGLIDGEGCLAIRDRKGWKAVSLEVVGTDRAPLDWAQAHFGGTVRRLHDQRPGRRQPWHWQISRLADAAAIARLIRPHLKVKRAEANLLVILDLLRSLKERPTGPVLYRQAEDHLARLSRLLKEPEHGGHRAYEEAMDLTIYLKQLLIEREASADS